MPAKTYEGIRIGPLWLHRLEQWDLECWPWLCAHWRTPDSSRRIFCLWSRGIVAGPLMLTMRALHIGRRFWRWS